jgi:large subunit ribosomal protein L15
MNLKDVHDIRVPRTARKRLGRGWGSGSGKTSGRGEKGAGRRSGTRFRLRFEGGQMPLYRRLPKKGFSNHAFRVRYEVVNVGELEKAFEAGAVVDAPALHAALLLPKNAELWKVLADGDLSKALTVRAHAASAGAREKIEKAGGKVDLVTGYHTERAEARKARVAKAKARAEAALATAIAEAEKAKAARDAAPKVKKGAKPAKGEKAARPPKAEGAPGGGAPKAEGGKPAGGGGKGGKPEGGKGQG